MSWNIDFTWVSSVAALVLGFLLKVLYDELKSPKLVILAVSELPFPISPEIKVIGHGIDNYYNAYRLKVVNREKRYLHCAAENCVAWIKLNLAPEDYQLCWVGGVADPTINVGDTREVDICARGNTSGEIIAPTERGYFEPSPRRIGDGTCELQGKVRITCQNGKKTERNITIKPSGTDKLEIILH
jgi:hypothetical protein